MQRGWMAMAIPFLALSGACTGQPTSDVSASLGGTAASAAQTTSLCDAQAPVLEGEQGAAGVPCTGCVDTPSLAAQAVTSDKIAPGSVGPSHLGSDAFAGTGGDFGSAATVARSDHAHAAATVSASGFMSAPDKSKLDLYSDLGFINCAEEFDYVEQGTSVEPYWPDAATRAEIYQYGWLCWNRADDNVKLSPLDTNITLNQYYANWNSADTKVCGRVSWISGSANTNPSILVHAQSGYYYGLRYLNGVSNTWHGRWDNGGTEGSGGVGAGDRWTLWVCR